MVSESIDVERCNTSTLVDYLSDRGLTAYGQSSDSDELTDRNDDRVRILKFLAQHPEGVLCTLLVHCVLKGQRLYSDGPGWNDLDGDAIERYDEAMADIYTPTQHPALDGSDSDYQFAYRFLERLDKNTDLVRFEDSNAGRVAYPTLELLDLISEGITETASADNELIYDREFCQNMLKTVRSDLKQLSESQKDLLANSLRRYIQRVEDYRLVFDVEFSGRRTGQDRRRMTKHFNTRFTSEGRVNKAFARLQSALEWGYEHGDNAVFCTLTTDPRAHDSLWDAIMAINENFHRLTQFLKTDPSTVQDTRRAHVPSWRPDLDSSNFHFGQEGAVSGRPRRRLEYTKVLEFTSAGYPHLHVLFYDVPTRDSDGMPWLIDKQELVHRWSEYGQGRIVDLYPLTYRDDIDDVGNFGETVVHDETGNTVYVDPNGNEVSEDHEHAQAKTRQISEGFVSWYRYGDHDHGQEWVEDKARWHKEDGLIDMDGTEDQAREKTAGAYIGKYISETYATLLNDEELDADSHDGKSALWKLAMYWATNRQFWSISRTIEEDIVLDDQLDSEVRRGVHDCTKTSVLYHSDLADDGHACYPDLDLQNDRVQSAVHDIVRGTLVSVDYLGTFAYWDLPASPQRRVSFEVVEDAALDKNTPVTLASAGDRPPPVQSVWNVD
jgi:hypothetical protein